MFGELAAVLRDSDVFGDMVYAEGCQSPLAKQTLQQVPWTWVCLRVRFQHHSEASAESSLLRGEIQLFLVSPATAGGLPLDLPSAALLTKFKHVLASPSSSSPSNHGEWRVFLSSVSCDPERNGREETTGGPKISGGFTIAGMLGCPAGSTNQDHHIISMTGIIIYVTIFFNSNCSNCRSYWDNYVQFLGYFY